MVSPKFAVNEEVIMVSETYPEYDGIYTITGIITVEDYLRIHPYVAPPYSSPYYYELEGLLIRFKNGYGTLTGNITSYVREAFLRKKHKPSEFSSFTNLMNNLKLPQKTPQEVK